MKDSKEIRHIMEDINQLISESYVFGKEDETLESDDGIGDYDLPKKINRINGASGSGVGGVNIDENVKQIRKIALTAITELSPSDNQEAYKLVKGIWDSCDKYLTRDVQSSEQKPKQTNNI